MRVTGIIGVCTYMRYIVAPRWGIICVAICAPGDTLLPMATVARTVPHAAAHVSVLAQPRPRVAGAQIERHEQGVDTPLSVGCAANVSPGGTVWWCCGKTDKN